MKKYIVRSAKPTDGSLVKELIYITDPDLFVYMFGRKAKDVLMYLFEKKQNLFSYEHCKIVEIGDEIAGMILGYGYEAIENESRNTGRLIIKFYGIEFLLRVFSLIKMGRIISDLNENHYYISNIAVFNEYRGQGIGKMLIENAIKEGKKFNKRYVALDVEENNHNAIEFYYHLGFKKQDKKTVNFGFRRRVALVRMEMSLID